MQKLQKGHFLADWKKLGYSLSYLSQWQSGVFITSMVFYIICNWLTGVGQDRKKAGTKIGLET